MAQLDILIGQLGTTDTRKKIQLGEDLISSLNSDCQCENIGILVDGILPWLHNSNFKVVLSGLEIMEIVIQRLGREFRPYSSGVINATYERLGDSKDVVREKTKALLFLFMPDILNSNQLLEKLTPAFTHKNAKVREEVMNCLHFTLNQYGSSAVTISRIIPLLIKLLSDPTATVRDTAFNTILETYRHYGDRLRYDLQNKYNIPQAKLTLLNQRFDELKQAGLLISAANGHNEDETDRSSVKSGGSVKSRGSSVPPPKREVPKKPIAASAKKVGNGEENNVDTFRRCASLRKKGSSSQDAGAMDEGAFLLAFEETPPIILYNAKNVDKILTEIREVIQNTENPWDKRIENIKKIRSVMLSGGLEYETFYSHIRLLEAPMRLSIKDLRSQVVREACLTVAYMSKLLQTKLDHFCESVFDVLINLIPNTVRIMATAATTTIRFIIRFTHHHKLIPILTRELNTSKSKEIRKAVCQFLDELVHTWSVNSLERHSAALSEAIKKGISDADSEARAASRRAYWGFADHFSEEANKLLVSLDPSYRKLLQGGMTPVPTTSSSRTGLGGRLSRGSSAPGSTENLVNCGRSNIPEPMKHIPELKRPPLVGVSGTLKPRPPAYKRGIPLSRRANSAIDSQAAKNSVTRMGARATPGASLPRPRQLQPEPYSTVTPISRTLTNRTPRTRGRTTVSQPGSRSGSPPRLNYGAYIPGSTPLSGRARGTRIPCSTGTSREPSPNRFGFRSRDPSPNRYTPLGTGYGTSGYGTSSLRRSSGSSGTPPLIPGRNSRQTMAQKMLQQSREAENALADALSLPPSLARSVGRKQYGSRSEDHSDNESETSSICSDRHLIYDPLRRGESPYYSHQRVLKESWDNRPALDINEIIIHCASTYWKDKKEGLANLHAYLMQEKKPLSQTQLRRITEIFTKMFVDTNTKAYSLFLDTVMALIMTHSADLRDWLYLLLNRLLTKLGSDLLGSVQNKIHATLDIVREYFKCEPQFQVLLRLLTDPTQTPNAKVKVATLTFLKCLVDGLADNRRSDGSSIFRASYDTSLALTKILAWTADQKSVEVRRAASAAFIAMYNYNEIEVTNILKELQPACQATAEKIIHNHRSRAASLDASIEASPYRLPWGARNASFNSPTAGLLGSNSNHAYSLNRYTNDDTENLNPDQVSKTLRRTMDEIRNFSFDAQVDGRVSLENRRDSTSQDSGISQLSAGGQDGRESRSHVESMKMVEETSAPLSGRSSTVASPTQRNLLSGLSSPNDSKRSDFSGEMIAADIELMSALLAELSTKDKSSNNENAIEETHSGLRNLITLAQSGSSALWSDKFRSVLRLLLDLMLFDNCTTRALAINCLTEMVKRTDIANNFLSFSELVILKVLSAQSDASKEVGAAVQNCCATIARVLPPDVVVRILKPLIQLSEAQSKQAAIKMLMKLVESSTSGVVETLLPEVMPALISAYYNEDLYVRKTTVFCLVAIHKCVGEANFSPYLDTLDQHKLRLLNLYIRRSQDQLGNSRESTPT